MNKESSVYINSYNGDNSIPLFIAFAIEQYKKFKGISGEEAEEILSAAGVLQHIQNYYDVLHTQSAQWLVAEMDEMVTNHNARK